jgi:polysaccharide biosynthesis protein PelA
MSSLSQPSSSQSPLPRPPMVFYYGKGNMAALTRYSRAVLQPGHYTSLELNWLRRHGVETLAYLDISGKSTGKPWQPKESKKRETASAWGKQFVRNGATWTQPVLEQVKTVFELGFSGVFLDTLESEDMTPFKRLEKLELIAEVRALANNALGNNNVANRGTLLANRGFQLMPELLSFVNGIVFEAFSTRWSPKGGYGISPKHELAWSATVALELKRKALSVYALDYADTGELKHFAKRRAEHFGFTSLIANRELTQL